MGNPISARLRARSRWRGAIAGLVPSVAIASLSVFGGTAATHGEVILSLSLLALIGMTAGWIAGPLAASHPRRLLVAALGYAIAFIGASAGLSIFQAASDSLAANGPDLLALAWAVLGRAMVALAGTTYLIAPAIVLGLAWSIVARGFSMPTLRRQRAWR